MAALNDKQELIDYWTKRLRELLQVRNNLDEGETAYVAEKLATMRDEKLKEYVTTLIGWGTDEKAELETFCAIAIELMKDATPSRVREASRRVELRFYLQRETK